MATPGCIVFGLIIFGAVYLPWSSGLRNVGCYHLVRLPKNEEPSLKLKVETCVHRCRASNSSYAAYRTPLCHCVFNLTKLIKVADQSCHYMCDGDSSLWCGGKVGASVYSTDPSSAASHCGIHLTLLALAQAVRLYI